MVTRKFIISELLIICAVCVSLFGCTSGISQEISNETSPAAEEAAANFVRSNPAAIGYSLEEAVENIPFSSYTYDFSAFENNYMITVTPDETRTGLVLTLEDNNFGFSTFNIYPPENYAVYLPYSQQEASNVCTVIRSTENEEALPDILKIDFYLSNYDNDELPYSVCRMYTVLDGKLSEIKVYGKPDDTEPDGETGSAESSLVRWDYIPESSIYQAEPLNMRKFMTDPKVTANDDGSFDVSITTYTIDQNVRSMTYNEEKISFEENPIYFGYAAYAIAGDIYKYFKDTSLNVSDYENYVEIPAPGGESSLYFFKVDDPRFHTVQELRRFAEKYFAKNIVDEMFLSAPQQYRDIDGELYTIIGDGGHDDSLGRLIFTGEMEEDLNIDAENITYYTKQEKFDENHQMTGYVDGGKFTMEFTNSEPGFIITQYRYPN